MSNARGGLIPAHWTWHGRDLAAGRAVEVRASLPGQRKFATHQQAHNQLGWCRNPRVRTIRQECGSLDDAVSLITAANLAKRYGSSCTARL